MPERRAAWAKAMIAIRSMARAAGLAKKRGMSPRPFFPAWTRFDFSTAKDPVVVGQPPRTRM
eukprot:3436956-Pyramimonas_sp.AAC.1